MSMLVDLFLKSAQEMLIQMGELKTELQSQQDNTEEFVSQGVCSVIGFIGKAKGRLILDVEPAVALGLASSINGESYRNVNEEIVLLTLSEINNTIAGDAITFLNNRANLSLRLTPPLVFTGKKASIFIPQLASKTVVLSSSLGQLKLHIAFDGGGK